EVVVPVRAGGRGAEAGAVRDACYRRAAGVAVDRARHDLRRGGVNPGEIRIGDVRNDGPLAVEAARQSRLQLRGGQAGNGLTVVVGTQAVRRAGIRIVVAVRDRAGVGADQSAGRVDRAGHAAGGVSAAD